MNQQTLSKEDVLNAIISLAGCGNWVRFSQLTKVINVNQSVIFELAYDGAVDVLFDALHNDLLIRPRCEPNPPHHSCSRTPLTP